MAEFQRQEQAAQEANGDGESLIGPTYKSPGGSRRVMIPMKCLRVLHGVHGPWSMVHGKTNISFRCPDLTGSGSGSSSRRTVRGCQRSGMAGSQVRHSGDECDEFIKQCNPATGTERLLTNGPNQAHGTRAMGRCKALSDD
jgi:hypothetical protein